MSSTDYFETMFLTGNNELRVVGQTLITSFPFKVYAPFTIKYDTNGNVLFDSLYTTDGNNNKLYGADFDVTGNIYLTYTVRLPNMGNKDFLRSVKYDTNMPSSLAHESIQIPKEIELSQNYPNPFNPTTKFFYTLLQSQFVTLKIYNLLGKCRQYW